MPRDSGNCYRDIGAATDAARGRRNPRCRYSATHYGQLGVPSALWAV
jgi:hypothetical protein